MLNREQLSKEHAELDALAVRLLEAVEAASPPTGLSALRWRLNHVLMVHLAKEDKLLYPSLMAMPTTKALAQRFSDEMGGLAEAYLAYNSAWPIERVEAEWAGFGVATRGVMKALRQRILREERDLYPRIAISTSAAA